LFNNQLAKAGTPVVHRSPKPLWLSSFKTYNQKPRARTIERGFFYALIEEQIQVEKQADYHHVIREIVSEAGIQNASQISISFDPAFERLDFHDITVWRDNKPLNRLNISAFKVLADEKNLSDFLYQGTFSALCILDDIRKGDRIEYSYTLTGRNPIFKGKYCDNIYFQWYMPIAHMYTAIIASAQRKLNFKYFNKTPKVTVSENGGLKQYAYEDFQVPAGLDDNNQPDWYDPLGRVQISEYNNWAEVVDWALSINPTATHITGELADRIKQLKTEAGDDKEKYFRAAVRTVQNEVRYMGIEIGQYSHRANDPQKVFKQRYGDCKDKSLLLVSMLNANGIEAHMVLVNASRNEHIADYIPTYYAFSHAVVTAFVNGKQVWIDATIDYQGGVGADIYFPDYGKGLVLKAGNNSLTTIPSSKNGKITGTDTYTIKNEKSPVLLTVKTVYTGNHADSQRDRLASNGTAETEKSYLEYYAKIYTKIERKDSIIISDDTQKNIITTTETYLISNFFKKDSTSNGVYAELFAYSISDMFPGITNQTKTPVSLTYPYDLDYTQQIILPAGWDVTPSNNAINRDYYRFSSNYSASGDSLFLRYKLTFLKDNVPLDKLLEFKGDIKKLNNNGLSYSFYYPGAGGASSAADVNNLMIILVGILIAGLIFVGLQIYQRETPAIVFAHGSGFQPVGGWLILIGAILTLTALFAALVLISSDYFSLATWNLESASKQNIGFKSFIVMEVACFTVLMCYSVYCLVLLINKRDILPRVITVYFLFTGAFFLIDFICTFVLKHNKFVEPHPYALIYSIIMAVLWIPYFKRSERVEDTFIVPYPPYNYSYEGPGIKGQ
jgi:transglutaminase-like putative cysteine protease